MNYLMYAAVLSVCMGSQAGAVDAISRFDAGADGRTVEGPATIEWQGAAGRQGGGLRVTRTASGEVYLVAPAPFLGNWSVYGLGGRVTLDYFLSSQSAAANRPLLCEVSGPAGSESRSAIYPNSVWNGVWSGISVRCDPVSPVFQNVTGLRIRLGLDSSLPVGEVFLMDTVHYQSCPANCDSSTAPPILNANDFQCFLNAFARDDGWCNFDGIPVNNAEDFQAFLNVYAVGCSVP